MLIAWGADGLSSFCSAFQWIKLLSLNSTAHSESPQSGSMMATPEHFIPLNEWGVYSHGVEVEVRAPTHLSLCFSLWLMYCRTLGETQQR